MPSPSIWQSRASRLTACRGRSSSELNYGLAIEPEDEPAGSSRTSPHLAAILRVLVQADDHLAPALHIQLAEQVVDMQLRCRETDIQPSGDFLVAEPRRDQLGGFPFAPGERECPGWLVAADAEALGDGDPEEQLGGHPAGAVLLTIINIHDEAHEIGRSGGVRT